MGLSNKQRAYKDARLLSKELQLAGCDTTMPPKRSFKNPMRRGYRLIVVYVEEEKFDVRYGRHCWECWDSALWGGTLLVRGTYRQCLNELRDRVRDELNC